MGEIASPKVDPGLTLIYVQWYLVESPSWSLLQLTTKATVELASNKGIILNQRLCSVICL